MSKQKIDLEFEMNTMPGVLYKYVATPDGLAKWFADDAASEDGTVYSFLWHKEISRAVVLDSAENVFIRFRWEEDEEDDYFEFRIERQELTGTYVLHVIDFSEEEEYDDVVRLWNFQIDNLKRLLAA